MAHALAEEIVSCRITKQFGADTVAVARGIRNAVDELAGALPEGVRIRVLYDQADLVDAAGRRLVDNRDPAAFDALVQALPARTRELLDALSPGRAVAGLRAPLFLIHGRADPAVPFTESLRLEAAARAAGRPVRTAIVGALGHVEADRRHAAADLLRLWATFYAFRRAAEG
jgi:fermentation-respiration switch protein FrsA (DUF1100 family)